MAGRRGDRRAPRRATIVQVAKLAGVSIKTVSRVSNGEQSVREPLRSRVAAAIRELRYHPSFAARSLAGRRSFLVGFVYDNPSPSYLLDLQSGVLRACQEQGFRLLFHPCDSRDPGLAAELVTLAQDLHLEGLVLTPPVCSLVPVLDTLAAQRVRFAQIAPTLAHAGGDAVWVDDLAAACEITDHLLALGHRRIGFVMGHPDHHSATQRYAGYRQALRSARVALDEALVQPGEFSFESGRVAGARLLALGRAAPTAILASNDDMAAGVIAAARERGLRLPDELSVCGFDDSPLAALLWPPLTTMRQPITDMAFTATQMLLHRVRAGRTAPVPARLAFELVTRASSAAPRTR